MKRIQEIQAHLVAEEAGFLYLLQILYFHF
jgi:hypothetical protein